ncbi:MAG TPA: hypothetical protein VHA35_23025 [Dongiaceae bacterium]|nr:hypothetical protein [Dongiaceae bacterium]
MARRRPMFRDVPGGVTACIVTALLAAGAGAQDFSALDRALRKPDPAGELVANFNELVSSAANIGAVPPTDQDRAAAAQVRGILQDSVALARARDANARAAAQGGAEFQQIPALAARLDQSIGTRLSGDARKGMGTDFAAVAAYMAIASPGSDWYCRIKPLGALVGC